MEVINESAKLIAQAIDALKYEPTQEEMKVWDEELNKKETVELLEQVLEKLVGKI